MNAEERQEMINLKGREQQRCCAYCGLPLVAGKGPVELAHRIPRGQLKMVGIDEWHPLAIALVCTRKGKNCNDGMLLPIGLARQELIRKIREESDG